MTSIVFDTSILIDFLRKKEGTKEILQKVQDRKIKAYISSITEGELYAGKESLNKKKQKAILDLIKLFEKILPSNEIAKKAGEFRRDYNVSLLDCIIAATAAIQNVKLWTKDIEDFRKIKEIEVEAPY